MVHYICSPLLLSEGKIVISEFGNAIKVSVGVEWVSAAYSENLCVRTLNFRLGNVLFEGTSYV